MKTNKKDQLTISVDSFTIARAIAIVIGALLLLAFIKAVAHALILLFISFFLALALNPAVSWISRRLKSRSRVRATGMAYVLVMAFLIGFFALVIPPLINQTVDFIKNVPDTIQDFKQGDSAVSDFVYRYDLDKQVDRFSSDFASRFADAGQPVLSTAGTVGTVVVSTITVLVLTFMMLVEGPSWFDRFIAAQPKNKRERRKKLANQMYRSVTGYVNGQVLIAFIAGGFSMVALVIFSTIYDVTVNAIALAGIVTLFALLPLIGTTLGAIIVVLASLFVSIPLAISMAIFFVVYQQIENVTIQPYIQSKTNNLTPLIVFSAALVGVSFGGILGAFIAIPAAACIRILLEDHYQAHLYKAEKN